MDFSVLLSVYKKESPGYLAQCLDSIIAQTVLPSEVILVKDGPLNEALEQVIASYLYKIPNFIIVPLKDNLGLGKALNEGLKYCSYDIVARMDTDDICRRDRFEKQLIEFNKDNALDVVSSWITEFDNSIDNIVATRKLPESHQEIYDYGKRRCPINHPAVMFRKSVVEKSGGYMHFPLFEDYYLWVRMLKNGAKFYNIQESLLYFRTSEAMYMRRGGLKYALKEISFLWEMNRVGYVSCPSTILNIIIRFIIRIIPNSIRGWVYKRLLR